MWHCWCDSPFKLVHVLIVFLYWGVKVELVILHVTWPFLRFLGACLWRWSEDLVNVAHWGVYTSDLEYGWVWWRELPLSSKWYDVQWLVGTIEFYSDIILQTFPFEPHHAIYTATCAKFRIASINKSEDREVWSFTQSHTDLSHLASVPNFRNKH